MKNHPKAISRRAVSTFLGSVGGLVLTGCGGDGDTKNDGSTGGGGSGNGSGGSSGASGGSTSPDGNGGMGGAGSKTTWATGGTKNMGSDFPDPFTGPVTSCTPPQSSTEGPCFENEDLVRKDISEGLTGLPMRLSLLVVDESCQPIEGAQVKIWHTQISGSYSGDPPTTYPCVLEEADATKHYFRGVQTSDAAGRVDFDTCFPGWYPVRAIHIHYTVTVGEVSFTSQWGFEEDLVTDIFENQPEYAAYGQPDVRNDDDGILSSIGLEGFVLQSSRQEDGSLLASKVVVIAI